MMIYIPIYVQRFLIANSYSFSRIFLYNVGLLPSRRKMKTSIVCTYFMSGEIKEFKKKKKPLVQDFQARFRLPPSVVEQLTKEFEESPFPPGKGKHEKRGGLIPLFHKVKILKKMAFLKYLNISAMKSMKHVFLTCTIYFYRQNL